MSYLSLANNTMSIAEQEYGTSGEIRFTTFTSCIGLIAKNGPIVTGIHLVLFDRSGNPFNAVDEVVMRLGGYQRVVVIGHTDDIWSQIPSYHDLIGRLHTPVIIQTDDGIYGGKVQGGVFQIYKNGIWCNI